MDMHNDDDIFALGAAVYDAISCATICSIAPLVIAGVQMGMAALQQKQQQEAIEEQKKQAKKDLYLQLLMGRANELGGNTKVPQTQRALQGINDSGDGTSSVSPYVMALVNAIGQSNGPTQTEKDELAELQQQKQTGFRNRKLFASEF